MSDLFGGLLGALGAFAGGAAPLPLGQQRAIYDPHRMQRLQRELLEAIYTQGLRPTPLARHLPPPGPGQTSLADARKQLATRREAYKALGIPEEAATIPLTLAERRRAIRDARGRFARPEPPPAFPDDIFERENLWITEATTETFSEWLERRLPHV